MATADQIASLRLKIGEPDEETYTDVQLSARIDALSGDLNKTAFEIWTEKAAAAAQLVDTSEGGSSRKMGDIYEQALNMAKFYAGQVEDGEPVPGGTGVRIKKLVRR